MFIGSRTAGEEGVSPLATAEQIVVLAVWLAKRQQPRRVIIRRRVVVCGNRPRRCVQQRSTHHCNRASARCPAAFSGAARWHQTRSHRQRQRQRCPPSRRRYCHSAAPPPSTFSRRFNMDGEGVSVK